MITKVITSHLFSRISEFLNLNSAYRPLIWRPNEVLSERRKASLRRRNYRYAIWSVVALMLLFMLGLISTVEPKVPQPGLTEPIRFIQPVKGNDIKPVDTQPVIEYMTDEEWIKMKEETYEWLGC